MICSYSFINRTVFPAAEPMGKTISIFTPKRSSNRTTSFIWPRSTLTAHSGANAPHHAAPCPFYVIPSSVTYGKTDQSRQHKIKQTNDLKQCCMRATPWIILIFEILTFFLQNLILSCILLYTGTNSDCFFQSYRFAYEQRYDKYGSRQG